MYILALLFSVVNFYFLLKILILLLGLFTEYIQIPLIIFCAKTLCVPTLCVTTFNLPMYYNLENALASTNQDNNEETENIVDNEELQNDSDDVVDKNELQNDSDDVVNNEESSKESENDYDVIYNESENTDDNSNIPDLPDLIECNENKLNYVKKTNTIIIDESLD